MIIAATVDIALMILRSIPARFSYLQRVCLNATSQKTRRLLHASFIAVMFSVLMILVLLAIPASFTVIRITTTTVVIFPLHPRNSIDGYVKLLSNPILNHFI